MPWGAAAAASCSVQHSGANPRLQTPNSEPTLEKYPSPLRLKKSEPLKPKPETLRPELKPIVVAFLSGMVILVAVTVAIVCVIRHRRRNRKHKLYFEQVKSQRVAMVRSGLRPGEEEDEDEDMYDDGDEEYARGGEGGGMQTPFGAVGAFLSTL